jgi:hypothetical protein
MTTRQRLTPRQRQQQRDQEDQILATAALIQRKRARVEGFRWLARMIGVCLVIVVVVVLIAPLLP